MRRLAVTALLALCLLLSSCAGTHGRTGDDGANIPAAPDGAVELTGSELDAVKNWFSEEPIRRRFLLSTYSSPADADLYLLFLPGTGDGYESGIEDISMFLGQYGWWGDFELSRITDEGMDSVLKKYAGISLESSAKRHLDGLYYVDAAGCRYSVHGNVDTAEFAPTGGYSEGDRLYVFYDSSVFVSRRLTGTFRVTLCRQDDGYVIMANEFYSDGEYTTDLYEPTDGGGRFESDETVEKVPLTAVGALAGASADEATANIRAQDGFLNVVATGLDTADIPQYGRIVAGKLDDELTLYYTDSVGTVYKLPLPEGDISEKDISFFTGDIYFVYTVEKTVTGDESLSVDDYYGTLLLPTGELFIRTVKSEMTQTG